MMPAPSKPLDIELPENTTRDRPKFSDIVVSASGTPRVVNTADNLQELATYCGVGFRFNMLEFVPETHDLTGDKLDLSFDQLRSEFVSAASRFGLPKAAIDDHLVALAENNKYHPVKHWLDSGEWDGIARLNRVVTCLNAEHESLAVAVIKHWLVGCVASLYEGSFKSKLVPVLQGSQSYKKTAYVERIASIMPHAFLEGAELNPDNKDSLISCTRAFIVELGELERTNKNSQGSLKAFITKSIDTVRPPYARTDIKKPRQTHFIATVNGDNFLKDETGSSRFVVLAMNKAADMDKLNTILGWHYDGTGSIKQTNPELLKQFWLEVKQLYQDGFGWMLSEHEITLAQSINESFNDKGSWYEYIKDKYVKENDHINIRLSWITAGELVDEDDNLTSRETGLIGKALKKLANEDLIRTRKGRANRTEYHFP
ncbi:VapE domain-containing protein [uncultured Paraglaciecola sp.]|uniref:VapE domain-containing protein n=1 Tax=uncultured Paraglaciecola sp. TaxID=1765024 RepID=UPI00260751AF|nr:VapE domain-containing protein [uncultured Paraglaciecola sp.]